MRPITIYFSFPFYPIKRKTHFYNGHLALGIEDSVYQAYNPKMLKSGFLISVMPISEWLFGKSKRWCFEKATDRRYKYVYLYGVGEAYRTKVYFVTVNNLPDASLKRFKDAYAQIEDDYQNKRCDFDALKFNCSTIIGNLIYDSLPIEKSRFDFLPGVLFTRIVIAMRAQNISHTKGYISNIDSALFKLHRFCLGVTSFSSERFFDSLTQSQRSRKSSLCIKSVAHDKIAT
jgi:hypothetical protein